MDKNMKRNEIGIMSEEETSESKNFSLLIKHFRKLRTFH